MQIGPDSVSRRWAELLSRSGGNAAACRALDPDRRLGLSQPHRAGAAHSRPLPAGSAYNAVHDTQMMVSGEAARTLASLVREHWSQTGARVPRPVSEPFDPWPTDVAPDLVDCEIGLARTRPAYAGAPELREVERL